MSEGPDYIYVNGKKYTAMSENDEIQVGSATAYKISGISNLEVYASGSNEDLIALCLYLNINKIPCRGNY